MTAIDRKPYIARKEDGTNERTERVRYGLLSVLADFISKNGKEALLELLNVDSKTVDAWFANKKSFTLADISDMEKAFNIQILIKNEQDVSV